MSKLLYEQITGKIIGCAMRVHSSLGNGFQEVIYQRALAIEFQQAGLAFARELEVEIYYRDHPKPIGKRRVDFLVENVVIVEIKAVTQMKPEHEAQTINYLKAYKKEVGLLLNFGKKNLERKRFISTRGYQQQ